MLAIQSQQVIWLRTMKLAVGGPRAHREARLMVTAILEYNRAEAEGKEVVWLK